VNENNSIAYTQQDDVQSDNTQSTSVYTSDNLVTAQETQTQNNLLENDESASCTPVNLQKDFVQSEQNTMQTLEKEPLESAQNPYEINTPLLQLNDLCKRYPGMGNYMSVFHMNLTILRGRIIGLLGPNGCGKTTLIKMINGLLAPTSGTVLINGMEPCPATKRVISYLPERTYLDNGMKVSQMVEYFADFYEDFSTEKAYNMLGALGISSSARLKTLSKGTKEKVQLILVMSRQADLYILDEPIAGVDPAARDYILRTIITNYNPGSTIILSTHLISDIENILDDVIFMKNGSLMLYTSVDSIRSQMGKSVDTYFREVYAC
jgi:ABC-2 type transport system ATP-binding protein